MNEIPYGKQYIDDEDINMVVQSLKGTLITQGALIEDFEEKVAKYHNCKFAIAFCNGTAALHGAYYASEISECEEFITSPITFVSSANAGLYIGAIPKFVDISPDTYCIDIDKIKSAITKKTKVITPVSFAGYPIDCSKIKEIIGDRNITIIHDAAHAIGAKLNNESIAQHADMTILSFHPVKHITTGEGGMVLTNNEKFAKKLKRFRSHGINKNCKKEGDWFYEMTDIGYNYRITDIQCALGISQMSKLDKNLIKRNVIAKKYYDNLKEVSQITLPNYNFDLNWTKSNNLPNTFSSYHLFPILVENSDIRKNLFDYLRSNNIFVQVHYIPVHLQPYYRKNFGFTYGDFPVSEDFYSREISIPMFYSLTDEELDFVIKTIKSFFS